MTKFKSMAESFKPGDVVTVKAEPGLHMVVVVATNNGEDLKCIYFNRLTAMFVQIQYPSDCFKKIS